MLRRGLWLLVIVAVGSSMVMGSAAFNKVEASRGVSVVVSGDSTAYLAITAVSGPHSCFVSQASTGKIVLNFASTSGCSSDGGGSGIAAGDGTSGKYSRYAFHDLLLVTNKGRASVNLYANATTTSGSESAITVAKESSANQMDDGDYAASSATSLPLTVGGTALLGVRVKGGTTGVGTDITGTIDLTARR